MVAAERYVAGNGFCQLHVRRRRGDDVAADALRANDTLNVGEFHGAGDRFHVDGGSWTNSISWVRGYDALLGPMDRVSALFFEKVLKPGVRSDEPRYRNALFHLLVSQTSCYRYWGQGIWVDYGREICRRLTDILTYNF